MHFLFSIYKYFPYGGLQKDMLRFAEEALSRGHEVTIFTSGWVGPLPKAGIGVRLCSVSGWSNHRRMMDFSRKFADFLKENKFDASMVINRIPGADFYFMGDNCMARWLPRKHSPLVLRLLPRYREYLRLEAELCAQNSKTKLLYIALPQKIDFQEYYHLPEDRLLYLPPGMDPRCGKNSDAAQFRKTHRENLGIRQDELVFVEVGTGLMRKGVDRSMKAVAYLLNNGVNARLLLIGGDKTKDVEALARKCHLPSQKLIFLGMRQDVPELMYAADVMVHPAREETAGSVLIEAIASGVPVICSEACGFRNFVMEATQTVVPEPFNQNALNAMMLEVSQNIPELAAKTAAYAPTQDFYGRSKVAIDYMENCHNN